MPLYQYVGLSKEQKKLSGVIEAPEQNAAQKKLHDLGIAVLSITENVAHEGAASQETKPVFEFEGLDGSGKKVVGTIVADDPQAAYVRLRDEYSLFVTTLFSHALSPDEKERAKTRGVAEFEELYQAQKKSAMAAAERSGVSTPTTMKSVLAGERTLGKEEQAVMNFVAYTMQRIQMFLEQQGNSLKPDQRTALQGYLNQLSRIKTSANLDHIVATTKKMLLHIHEQELFAQEDLHTRESLTIKVETKQLLEDLKKTSSLNQPIDLEQTISKLPFLKPLAQLLHRFKVTDEKLCELDKSLRQTNAQLFTYLKIGFLGSSPNEKAEAWKSISTLRNERRRIKDQIAARKQELKHTEQSVGEPARSLHWQYIAGWIVSLYLAYYFLTYSLSVKEIPLQLPNSFAFYNSVALKTLTIFFFLAYCALFIKNRWMNNFFGSVLTYGLAALLFILAAINLL